MDKKYVLEQKHRYRPISFVTWLQPLIIVLGAFILVYFAVTEIKVANQPQAPVVVEVAVDMGTPLPLATNTPMPTSTPEEPTATPTPFPWQAYPDCTLESVQPGETCSLQPNASVYSNAVPPTPTPRDCPAYNPGATASEITRPNVVLICRKPLPAVPTNVVIPTMET